MPGRDFAGRFSGFLTQTTLILATAGLLLLSAPVAAHEDGTDEFPCDEGPFGVPGLNLPPAQIGQWAPVMEWPAQATHSTVLPTGKVLWWRGEAPLGEPSTTYLWDPATGTIETHQLAAANTFCSGHATLPDGRVIVQGGTADPARQIDGVSDTNAFDPWAETWIRLTDTHLARWYPTLTALPDGRLLATAGLIFAEPREDATIPEIYDPVADTWTLLPQAELAQNLYPITFVLPDGKLFYNANFRDTLVLDPATWTWQPVGDSTFAHSEGTGVMYRPGKILRMGGGEVGIAQCEVIDMTAPAPAWRPIAPLSFPRRRPDLTLLPDGTAIAIGGSIEGQSSPECAMHAAEIWDPDTETWTTMASMDRPRIYHSTAVLLADGRVLTAGGEDSHTAGGQRSAEIYSPPYLFNGPRPVIGSAPDSVGYDAFFEVGTADAASIASVVMMRPSAVTHNFDQNQRYVPLTFVADSGALQVTAPQNANLAPPGYYMMFLVNGDGVPSEAAWIQVGSAPTERCTDDEDNDGDGLIDADDPDCFCRDRDGDGFADCVSDPTCNPTPVVCGDCDDSQPATFPDAAEQCDLSDNDCDGQVDEEFDDDGDGYSLCQGECDDSNPAVNPGAQEFCDGLDNDCDSLVDEHRPIVLDQDFEGLTHESDPPGWVDTGPGNSLVETDLYHVHGPPGSTAFSTHSELVNIHSHYVSGNSGTWSRYRVTGRLRIVDPTGGTGVTVLSDFPNSDHYYRLRRFASLPVLHLSPHGTTANCDTPDTGVDPADGAWYEFEIEAGVILGVVRVKVWREGSPPPSAWQQTCIDENDVSRRTVGTIGVWSMGPGSKFWDDLVVQLDETLPDVGGACGTGEIGACASGIEACENGALVCVGEITPVDEVCDGEDNDCDGQADEELGSEPTSCGLGVCATTGVEACVDGQPSDSCEPLQPLGPDDPTCDGIDDDCDGVSDDDFPSTTTQCGIVGGRRSERKAADHEVNASGFGPGHQDPPGVRLGYATPRERIRTSLDLHAHYTPRYCEENVWQAVWSARRLVHGRVCVVDLQPRASGRDLVPARCVAGKADRLGLPRGARRRAGGGVGGLRRGLDARVAGSRRELSGAELPAAGSVGRRIPAAVPRTRCGRVSKPPVQRSQPHARARWRLAECAAALAVHRPGHQPRGADRHGSRATGRGARCRRASSPLRAATPQIGQRPGPTRAAIPVTIVAHPSEETPVNFDIPDDLAKYLLELDDFIEREIKPLEQANDNIRFFDHRREDARTDWERGGLPNGEWEELLGEARRLADAAGHYRYPFPKEFGGKDGTNLGMAIIREHLAAKGLGLHNDLQNEHSIVGNNVGLLLDDPVRHRGARRSRVDRRSCRRPARLRVRDHRAQARLRCHPHGNSRPSATATNG